MTDPRSSPITLEVNGRRTEVHADPETPLVLVLRGELGLKGVRPGCAVGVCGACTVLSDGRPIRTCETPVTAVAGTSLLTPEGLGTPGRPHPVQQAFIDEQAAQCGYCINGIIMATAAAAAGNPGPAGESEKPGPHGPAWLTEHMCRCGTHTRIVRAINKVLAASDGASARSLRAGGTAAGDDEDAAGVGGSPSSEPPRATGDLPSDRVESWMGLRADGIVEARSGKVEIGQGIRTAMRQIAAAALELPIACVVVPPAHTSATTDERYTSGSNSVDTGGRDLARAAAAFRRLLLARAAEELGTDARTLALGPGGVVGPGRQAVSLAELAAAGPLTGEILPADEPDWSRLPLGQPHPRGDLRAKLTGAAAYVHDIDLPGMLHARALLPPGRGSELEHLDVAEVGALPGVLHVVRDDRLVVAVAEREEQAVSALARLDQSARWQSPDGGVDAANLVRHLRDLPVGDRFVERDTLDVEPEGTRHGASYDQPYQAHAAIAPSCAVAHEVDGVLRVYSHTQGIHPTRRAVAALLDRPAESVEVVHRDGPGCYGYNLSDDAAAFAALASLAVGGRPVRFQFTAEQEFAWEPLGSAMVADLSAVVDPAGRIAAWRHRTITDAHSTRPNGRRDRLMPSWLSSARDVGAWPGAGQGGARNSAPLYDIPAVEAVADHVQAPLRTGPLRTLGAFLNTFASESFADEVAEVAGADPLAFRLAHLTDERARHVLELVAEKIGYRSHVGPSGRGVGLAVARYHLTKSYVATAVEAEVDPETAEVTLRRVVLACDAGVIVNFDGTVNQLEGGTVQGLSRALCEAIGFDRRGAVTSTWLDYDVLGLTRVPPIAVTLAEDSPHPPLGVGEAAPGPAAAALANAIDDGTGIRLRSLPFTPKRILDRLYAMGEAESARVLA